jgi:hypothetical protein
MARHELEPLEHAVEIIDDSGREAVDIDERIPLRHLDADTAEEIAAEEPRKAEYRIWIWIPLPEAQIIRVVHPATVATALGVSRNDGKRNQQGRAGKEGEGSKAHGSESPSRRY